MDKDSLKYLAKLAEECEDFEDMRDYVKQFIVMSEMEISTDERNMLVMAYKKCMSQKRKQWKTYKKLERQERSKMQQKNCNKVSEFRKKVEDELQDLCTDLFSFLRKTVVPRCKDQENIIFFKKLHAHFLRYQSEFLTGTTGNKAAQDCQVAYQEAL